MSVQEHQVSRQISNWKDWRWFGLEQTFSLNNIFLGSKKMSQKGTTKNDRPSGKDVSFSKVNQMKNAMQRNALKGHINVQCTGTRQMCKQHGRPGKRIRAGTKLCRATNKADNGPSRYGINVSSRTVRKMLCFPKHMTQSMSKRI